jgi:tryptophan halogenase
MKKKVESIVIVGGGSAGWMTASFLCKMHPDLKITVVESPNVPTIGVGESTIGSINHFLGVLGLKDEDWMPHCNAAYKLAIQFTDFRDKGTTFYYPFGVKDTENTGAGVTDWYLNRVTNPDSLEFSECFYSVMPFCYNNKMMEGDIKNFSFRNDSAYQLDAILFAKFLKEKYALPRGVELIQKHVKTVSLDEDGYIDYIQTDDDTKIYADLFVDCSGFKSMLLEKTLGVKHQSFESLLLNNKAWAAQVPYTDKEKELGVVTNCTALGNGWVWYTPLYSRIGTGYVFSDKFTTEEEALQEYKDFLDSDKMPVHNPERSKDLTFRLIDVRNGTHEKCWHKNCIAIGLSWGFIEPLESSGLMFVQEAIVTLSQSLGLANGILGKIHADNANFYMNSVMNAFKLFVAYHFTLSQRRDTKYWRYVTEETDMFSHDDFGTIGGYAGRILHSHQIESNENGIPDILAGMQTYPANKTQMEMVKSVLKGRGINNQGLVDPMTLKYWEQKYKYFTNLASKAQSHNQVLKKNIYKGK